MTLLLTLSAPMLRASLALSNLSANSAAHSARCATGFHNAGSLIFSGAFPLAVRKRSTGTGGGFQFVIGEIERHARIVAPSSAAVHAVPPGA